MRNFLALCGVLCLFFCGVKPTEELPIAEHGINSMCPGNARSCRWVSGSLVYTKTVCHLRIDTVTSTYAVVKWFPKEGILKVKGGNFTGFFIINDRQAQFVVTPDDKQRYKEAIITYRFYETIHYEY